MRLICALSALALALSACSSNAADGTQQPAATPSAVSAAPARHPVSGLKVAPLTVTHGGKAHTFQVEVAGTVQEQAKGLMFRNAMGANEGMIFPMAPPRSASFWMRNTLIPLDIIFVGVDGRITNIWENAVPYSEEPLPSTGLVKGVLELNGGRAKQLGITAGDKVEW